MLFSVQILAQNKDGNITTPEFFSNSYIIIKTTTVEGNKRTKDRIIIRELDFKLGDSLAIFNTAEKVLFAREKRIQKSDSSELIMRLRFSRENIVNTKLFLTVDISLDYLQKNEYNIRIVVHERWYFWAFPVVRVDAPNFNDWLKEPDFDYLNMGLFTSHNNLWGLSHQASLVGYFGNSQRYGFGYFIPWIGHGQKIGLLMGVVYSNSGVVEYAFTSIGAHGFYFGFGMPIQRLFTKGRISFC